MRSNDADVFAINSPIGMDVSMPSSTDTKAHPGAQQLVNEEATLAGAAKRAIAPEDDDSVEAPSAGAL
jgi:hypothetical protein